ncbi:MAG: ketopantoate reductase family protein, partial [Actinomycetota bacterium]|nr:ketopantoate reductase family protein [Actinomycetota bacterium]
APSDAADELVERAQVEGEQVIAAAGIACVSAEADRERRGDTLRRRKDLTGPAGGSTWQSLSRGVSGVEIDYLAGEIVLLGRLHGVPTPVNGLIRQATLAVARAGGPPRSVDAAQLLTLL